MWWIVGTLLAIQAGLIGYSATLHSPTALEPGSLAAGISHWRFRRFELFRVNPPLPRMIAAIPVILWGYEGDWEEFNDIPGSRPGYRVGADFMAANGQRSQWLFTIARWACLPFPLLGGLFCFLWSREVFAHDGAGLTSLVLWVFEPNVLAHGQLITTDCAATAFGLGAGYFFWRWLKHSSWPRALAAGLFLGFAQLSKMSWLFLFALWPLMWGFWRLVANRHKPTQLHIHPTAGNSNAAGDDGSVVPSTVRKQLGQLATMFLLAVYLINVTYCFDGTLRPLGDFSFVSRTLADREHGGRGNRFANSWLGRLKIPLPLQYVAGFDTQKKDFESYRSMSYLRGQWKKGGWWYYYLYGLWVKIPHGTQFLLVLSLICTLLAGFSRRLRIRRRFEGREGGVLRDRMRDQAVVALPSVVLFLLASWQLEFNIHFRYVLPSLGLLLVVCGGSAVFASGYRRARAPLLYLPLVGAVLSSLWVYPHQLSYFNLLSGGPRCGGRHMLGSNLDWGQDYLFLVKWLESHPEMQLAKIDSGMSHLVSLSSMGLECDQGLNAVSSSSLSAQRGSQLLVVSVNQRLRKKDNHKNICTDAALIGTINYTLHLYARPSDCHGVVEDQRVFEQIGRPTPDRQ